MGGGEGVENRNVIRLLESPLREFPVSQNRPLGLDSSARKGWLRWGWPGCRSGFVRWVKTIQKTSQARSRKRQFSWRGFSQVEQRGEESATGAGARRSASRRRFVLAAAVSRPIAERCDGPGRWLAICQRWVWVFGPMGVAEKVLGFGEEGVVGPDCVADEPGGEGDERGKDERRSGAESGWSGRTIEGSGREARISGTAVSLQRRRNR